MMTSPGSWIWKPLISYWGWEEIVVLFATIAAGIATCLLGRALRPLLTLLPVFGLYEAILNVALFGVAMGPVPNHVYFYLYWYGAIGESLLVTFLAIEITCALLPRKQFALSWCAGLALLLVLSIGSGLPIRTEAAILRATLAGDFIAALVLASMIYFPEIRWSRGFPFIVAGVVLPAAVHAACSIHWQQFVLTAAIQALLPLASLAGLGLFLLGIKGNRGADCGSPLDAHSKGAWPRQSFGDGLPEVSRNLPATSQIEQKSGSPDKSRISTRKTYYA